MKCKVKWARAHQDLIEQTLGSITPSLSWIAGFDFAIKKVLEVGGFNGIDIIQTKSEHDAIANIGENEADNEPD